MPVRSGLQSAIHPALVGNGLSQAIAKYAESETKGGRERKRVGKPKPLNECGVAPMVVLRHKLAAAMQAAQREVCHVAAVMRVVTIPAGGWKLRSYQLLADSSSDTGKSVDSRVRASTANGNSQCAPPSWSC